MQLESAFERKCIDELRDLEHSWWPAKVESFSVRGLPDRVGCINGRLIALEFKRSKKESTDKGRAALQKITLSQIKLAGGLSYFVSPELWPEIHEELKQLAKGIV
jgi:hypothetical protein